MANGPDNAAHGLLSSKPVWISALFLVVVLMIQTGGIAYWGGSINGRVSQNRADIVALKAQAAQNKTPEKIDMLTRNVALMRQELGYDEAVLREIAQKVGAYNLPPKAEKQQGGGLGGGSGP